jgi:hypothetical protein
LTVTGKAADGVPLADVVSLADVVLLDDEPQPVRAATQAAAVAKTAASRSGVLIAGYFLPIGGKEGETVGTPWGSTPWRPRRITLPTRADVVRRAGVDLAWIPP